MKTVLRHLLVLILTFITIGEKIQLPSAQLPGPLQRVLPRMTIRFTDASVYRYTNQSGDNHDQTLHWFRVSKALNRLVGDHEDENDKRRAVCSRREDSSSVVSEAALIVWSVQRRTKQAPGPECRWSHAQRR